MERADIRVANLSWDDNSRAKVRAHGLTEKEVDEVVNNSPRFFINWPDRSAQYAMLGPDANDRFIFVAIVPTHEEDVWYVVTAYRMNRRRALKLYEGG